MTISTDIGADDSVIDETVVGSAVGIADSVPAAEAPAPPAPVDPTGDVILFVAAPYMVPEFVPSGLPPVTTDGTAVPAASVDSVIAQALALGVIIERKA